MSRWRALPGSIRSSPRVRDDRGSAASELIVLAVVAFAFVAVIVFAGRMNVGSAHTEAAARAAARTMSLDRDPASARGRAEEQARRIVDEGSAMCRDMAFSATVLTDRVTVEVECTVDLDQAALAEVPGTMQLRADATESIDPYREGP